MKQTAFAAALSLALPLLATAPASADTMSTQDFVNNVAISDMFEVQAGQLASKKAAHDDVQDFGNEMVDDHTETTKDLKELVKDENIKATFPTELDAAHKAKLDKLSSASDKSFDMTYVPMQVDGHEKAVAMFEGYSKSGENQALKEWAGDTLPTLKDHLKEAKALNTEIAKPAKTADADDRKPMVTAKNETKATDDAAIDHKAMDEKAAADDDAKPTPPSFEYVTNQATTDWTANSLIGRTVKNEDDQTLGDINNVILNEKGKVVAVTIGVGGFLGLGEKDVGVPFEALKFRTEKAMDQKTEDQKDAKAEDKPATDETVDDASHSDMVVVVDATKEQLEAAPTFVWLGEKPAKRADNESGKTVE